MLEDFIQANSLSAKILPYAAKGSLVKCRLFSGNGNFVLAIFLEKDMLSLQKLKEAAGLASLEQAEKAEVEEVTGYRAEFLPPISVYGVKAIVDKKLLEKEKVKCIVAEERTLEITPKEILEANEKCIQADLTL